MWNSVGPSASLNGGHDGALEHHEGGGGEDAEKDAHEQVAPERDGRLVRHARLRVGAHLENVNKFRQMNFDKCVLTFFISWY